MMKIKDFLIEMILNVADAVLPLIVKFDFFLQFIFLVVIVFYLSYMRGKDIKFSFMLVQVLII